jgi:hypothetical protein
MVRHKRAVYAAGVRLGVPRWRLVLHDWSKFLPGEWRPYVAKFGHQPGAGNREGYYHQPRVDEWAFNRAWVRHIHRHDHHWEHWVIPPRTASSSRWQFMPTHYGGNRPSKGGGTIALWRPEDAERSEFDRLGRVPLGAFYVATTAQPSRQRVLVDLLLADANRPQGMVVEMTPVATREMVADWCGAGAAQGAGSDPLRWYTANRDDIILHPTTRAMVDRLVGWEQPDA